MKKVINVFKPPIKTCLEVIQDLKAKFPEYKDQKVSYAGRLDPLASGVLVLLVGEEAKQREKYLTLPKIYEFSAILGLQTDSYDLLGLLTNTSIKPLPSNLEIHLNEFIKSKTGKHVQPFPPYSAKPFKGQPLFYWAKKGQLTADEIPSKEIEIFTFELLSFNQLSLQELQSQVNQALQVKGDFRQDQISNQWQHFFEQQSANCQLLTVNLQLTCSSGTYVRSIVNNLGNFLGCSAVTLNIKRTAVGNFKIQDSIDILA